MLTKKLTIDLTNENKEILERVKKEKHMSYGYTINTLISIFCKLHYDVKEELIEFCVSKMRELKRAGETAGVFERNAYDIKLKSYKEIAEFLSKGDRINIEAMVNEPIMEKLPIGEGYLLYPEECIIINPEEAKERMYAVVIECRNSTTYQIPHFIYLSDYKYSSEFPEGYTEHINERCKKAWPRFEEIMSRQVKLRRDPSRKGAFLNAEEYRASPTIGHFSVYEYGDSTYPADFEPPMGIMIVRANN